MEVRFLVSLFVWNGERLLVCPESTVLFSRLLSTLDVSISKSPSPIFTCEENSKVLLALSKLPSQNSIIILLHLALQFASFINLLSLLKTASLTAWFLHYFTDSFSFWPGTWQQDYSSINCSFTIIDLSLLLLRGPSVRLLYLLFLLT